MALRLYEVKRYTEAILATERRVEAEVKELQREGVSTYGKSGLKELISEVKEGGERDIGYFQELMRAKN